MRIIFQRPASAHRRLNSCQFDLSNYFDFVSIKACFSGAVIVMMTP